LQKGELKVNFDIFFSLIGLPVLILITALICHVHTGIKEEVLSMKKEIKKNSFSTDSNQKGGISQ
jgi:hypothetical protein